MEKPFITNTNFLLIILALNFSLRTSDILLSRNNGVVTLNPEKNFIYVNEKYDVAYNIGTEIAAQIV